MTEEEETLKNLNISSPRNEFADTALPKIINRLVATKLGVFYSRLVSISLHKLKMIAFCCEYCSTVLGLFNTMAVD